MSNINTEEGASAGLSAESGAAANRARAAGTGTRKTVLNC